MTTKSPVFSLLFLIFLLDVQAGLSKVLNSSRNANPVIGGNNADIGNIKYQVCICKVNNTSFVCGGSIIAENWVLTAAHCVSGEQDPKVFELFAGTIMKCGASPRNTTISLYGSKIIVHEDYIYNQCKGIGKNDIALVQPAGNFQLEGVVGKICIPNSGFQAHGSAVISGWGNKNYGLDPSSGLQWAYVSIISDSNCSNIYEDINASHVCAGNATHTPCNGDSGGPLASNNRSILAGIVSGGLKSCNNSAVFTEVSYFTEWITAKSGVEPMVQPCEPL